MGLGTDSSQPNRRQEKLWPLRYVRYGNSNRFLEELTKGVSLKDGVIYYYKLHDAAEDMTQSSDNLNNMRSTSNGYKSDGFLSDDTGLDKEDLLISGAQERGAIDLRRTGVMLRLAYPTNNFGQEFQQFDDDNKEDDKHLILSYTRSPTQYQFEIVYNNIMNPKEWNTWTLCAPTKESLFNWLAAISSVIYANRTTLTDHVTTSGVTWIDADKEDEQEKR